MNCLESTSLKLSEISKNLDLYAEKAVVKSEAWMIDINRANMMQGFNTDGSEIGGYASYIYEQLKSRMNPKAGGRVDLFLDGGYQGSMFVEIKGGKFKIESEDEKYSELTANYGDKHFGVPDKDWGTFGKVLMSELTKLINI